MQNQFLQHQIQTVLKLTNQTREFLESRKTLVFATLLGFCMLWMQAHHPSYSYHIASDVGTYYQRAITFSHDNSWSNIGANEYLPGALYFFLMPLAFTKIGYVEGVILLNLLFLALHLVLLFRSGGSKTAWVGLVLIVAAGPIILYRFEALVSLLVLEAYLFWKRGIPFACGVLLGFATAIKLYPMLLVPIFFKASRLERKTFSLEVAVGFVLGLLFVVATYLVSGGTTAQIVSSLEFHSLKPIGVESVAGVLLTLQHLIFGTILTPVNAYGIHGLSGDLIKELFTMLLAIFVLLLWGVYTLKRSTTEKLTILSSLSILLILLVFSANFQPQYLFWPLIFVSLMPINVQQVNTLLVIGLYCLMLIFQQFIYPLGYSDFLTIFTNSASQPGLLGFAIAGKLLLVAITILVLKEFVSETRLSKTS